MQKWIDIPNTESLYQVSDNGEVRSFSNNKWGRRIIPLKMKIYVTSSGHHQIVLKGNKHYLVHKLMYELFIGPVPEGYELDHKDRNPSNNILSNLRLTTKQGNTANREKKNNNTSGYKGVASNYRIKKPWRAYIGYKGKHVNLGSFSTKEEAARAYDKKAKELFGEFACLNFKENEQIIYQ